MWPRPATFAETSFLSVSHTHDSYQEQSLLVHPLSCICLLSPGEKTHLVWIPRVLFLKEEEKLTLSVHNGDRSHCKDETWSSELSENGGQTGRGACLHVCWGRSGFGLTQSFPTPFYLGHITGETSVEFWGHQGGRHMVGMKAVSSAGPAPTYSALWQSRGSGLPSETRLL